ncbi:hypothetical protein HON71_03585 [Candidatus Woesearchaeota archaeon]|nr:hypothetical protein [Candidatus Woesearchaeota archaeon]
MIRKILTILALISLAMLVVACATETVEETSETVAEEVEESAAPVATTPGVYQVAIENFKFKPTDLNIKVGERVEWINKDYSSYTQEIDDLQENEEDGLQKGIAHTVTFESMDSDIHLPVGGTATVTFTGAGTFKYFCQYHPSMQGTITVS